MPNEELIRTVIKRIERDIEMWDQSSWGAVNAHSLITSGIVPETVKVPAEAKNEGLFHDELTGYPVGDMNLGLLQDFPVTCNTSFCFAGHTVLEAGDVMLVHEDGGASLCRTPDGKVRHIHHRAMELLGLTEEQAGELFSAGIEDLDELKRAIAYHAEVDLL